MTGKITTVLEFSFKTDDKKKEELLRYAKNYGNNPDIEEQEQAIEQIILKELFLIETLINRQDFFEVLMKEKDVNIEID